MENKNSSFNQEQSNFSSFYFVDPIPSPNTYPLSFSEETGSTFILNNTNPTSQIIENLDITSSQIVLPQPSTMNTFVDAAQPPLVVNPPNIQFPSPQYPSIYMPNNMYQNYSETYAQSNHQTQPSETYAQSNHQTQPFPLNNQFGIDPYSKNPSQNHYYNIMNTSRSFHLNNNLSLSTSVRRQSFRCHICSAEFPTSQAFGGHMSSHSKARKAKERRPEITTSEKKRARRHTTQSSSISDSSKEAIKKEMDEVPEESGAIEERKSSALEPIEQDGKRQGELFCLPK